MSASPNNAFATVNGYLGKPKDVDLTNAKNLPISTGVSGLGAGVAAWLAQDFSESGSFATIARTAVADTNATATGGSRIIAFTSLSAARTVALPAASAFPIGNVLWVIDESGSCSATNTITLNRDGSDTINGATSAVLSSAYGFIGVESDGVSKWTVVSATAKQMGANTIRGNNTGGTAAEADLTAAQVTAMLSAFSGATGSAGVKGLVPAPAARDGWLKKTLMASGSWQALYNTDILTAKNPPLAEAIASGAWTPRAGASANTYNSVCYGDDIGVLVAVGAGGSIMTSEDEGETWDEQTAPEANNLTSVCRAKFLGLFIAVASDGTDRVITSPDGKDWTPRTAAEQNAWQSVCSAEELGIVVAVASSGTNRVMTSTNGTAWTPRLVTTNNWLSVCWSRELSKLVAVASSGTNRVMVSTTGTSWTGKAGAENNTWRSVCWDREHSRFVAVSADGTNRVMVSLNGGDTWVSKAAAAANQWLSVTYGDQASLLVAVANSGTHTRVMTSTDGGDNWTLRANVTDAQWRSVTFTGERFVAVGLEATASLNVMVSRRISSVAAGVHNTHLISLGDYAQDGAADSTTGIQKWFAAITATLTNTDTQAASVIGYVPEGVFTSSTGVVLEVGIYTYGVNIVGTGWGSVLKNIEFNVGGKYFQMRDLSLVGNTGVDNGIVLGSGSSYSYCVGLNIRGKKYGVRLTGASPHYFMHNLIMANETGVYCELPSSGNHFSLCAITENTENGILYRNGGEMRADGCYIAFNRCGLRISPSVLDTDYVNESYYTHCSISGNGQGAYLNTNTITSIASYDSGNKILVTLSGSNELTRGLGTITLTGTGIAEYDGVTTYVYDVLSDTEVVVDLDYHGGTTGTLNSPGYDVILEGYDGPNDIRSQYFTGCNINNLKVNCGHAIQFNGTRLKQRIWMGSATLTSQISFVNIPPDSQYGDGRAPSSEQVREIPISGPGAVSGWTQLITTQIGKSSFLPGKEIIAMRAPAAGTALNADRTAATINEIRVGTAGTYINGYPSEIEFSLTDDAATTFTIPNGRLGAVICLSGADNSTGETYTSIMGEFAIDAGPTPAVSKWAGGALIDAIASGGALTGTTGADGHVSISAVDGGIIHVENRNSTTRRFRLRYLN